MKKNSDPTRHYTSLDDVARRLHDERVDRIAQGYKERRVSVIRVVLTGLILAWAALWMLMKPKAWHDKGDLWIEAAHLFPWALGIFVACAAWVIYLQLQREEPSEWMEKGGAVANYVGIWILLSQGWNIAISMITLLPLSSIVIGTRFGRKVFYAGMVLSVILLGTAAPKGYWLARPAFVPFALILLIGLPLTVVRLLSALYAISATALQARDAQSRIIAMISHELRTPLNTICNVTHVVDTTGLSPADKEMMNMLANNANALLSRVNQVIDVAAIDHGKLHLAEEPFDIPELLRTMQHVLGSLASDKGLVLEVADRAGLADAVVGDATRIEQVLTNLTSNAIKCTPVGGHVGVTVETVRQTGDGVTLRFSVSDTGVGISDAEKTRIFQPFVQLSTGARRHSDGTGLGLYIVQGLTRQLGASLSVQDRPGGGTVFSWVVTLAKASPGRRLADTASVVDALEAHRAQGRPLNLLVIDDNRANREILQRLMQRAGHATTLAKDGQSGLACLKEAGASFDAVFLDLHMPDMSGQDVLTVLEQDVRATPVIVLSADSDPDVVNATLARGAVAYLIKPVAPHKVLEALDSLRRAEAAPRAHAVSGP